MFKVEFEQVNVDADIIHVFLMFLLLTLDMFYMFS